MGVGWGRRGLLNLYLMDASSRSKHCMLLIVLEGIIIRKNIEVINYILLLLLFRIIIMGVWNHSMLLRVD